MAVTTKLGSGATNHEGLPIKSHGYIITWSCEIIWQTKIIYPQCLWLPKFGRVDIYTEELPSINSHNALTTWSREILHLLYLYCNKAYGHQTWQGCDLLWETSTNKVTELFEHMVTRGYVIDLNITSTTRMPMTTKPCRFVTFSEEPPRQNQKTLWPGGHARSRDILTMLYFHYYNDYGYQMWLGGSICWRPSLDKVANSLDCVVLQGHVTYLLYHKTSGH